MFSVSSGLIRPLILNKSCSLRSISATTAPKKIAVILSGCGVYDGSEIHEASACLIHLSRGGAETTIFAPDIDQMHVIDHTKGEEINQSRNVLVESARIARGNIRPLSDLNCNDHDGVLIPGGFGAAKNLCSWAVDGVDCVVNCDVDRILKEFHSKNKPIGLTCIAPVLAAKCLPSGVEITLGHSENKDGRWPYSGTVSAVQECGAVHVEKDVTECHVDKVMKVITTPAYMCETAVHEVSDGINALVTAMLEEA